MIKLKEILNLFKDEKDPLDGLKSSATRKKERDRKFKKRALAVAIMVPALFFILQLLIKSYFVYYAQFDESKIKKEEIKPQIKDYKLEVNNFSRWQDRKDKVDESLTTQVDLLSKNVSEVKTNVSEGINNIQENIKFFEEKITKAIEDKNANLNNKIEKIIDSTNKKIDVVESTMNIKMEDIKKNSSTKLSDLSVAKVSLPKLDMPELPKLNENNKDINEKVIFQNKIEPFDNALVANEEVYEEVEEIYTPEAFAVSTLESIENKNKKKEKETPSFYMMPGFAKAVIVAGADVPTMETGTTSPKKVWMSISSEQLIANNGTANLKDCLVSGIATGRIANSRAIVKLDKISCEMTDTEGNIFKIHQSIAGTAYGEDGKSGAKGRLVSKEGEIIAKGLPLAALEGAISMLANTNNYILPSGSTASNVNPMNDFATAGAGTSSQVLQKFSEYYLKVLEQMNPYIEIRAKREITIAFDGGETIKMEKYNPMDTDYFYNQEDKYEKF